MKYFTHDELCDIAEIYLRNTLKCSVTAKELVSFCSTGEIPDVIGFRNNRSYLIEVKCSRSDFFADKKKLFREHEDFGMGDYRYFLCPKGMISEDELPDKWGLLYVADNGRTTIQRGKRNNIYIQGQEQFQFEKNIMSEFVLLVSLARRVTYIGVVKEGNWRYESMADNAGITLGDKAREDT